MDPHLSAASDFSLPEMSSNVSDLSSERSSLSVALRTSTSNGRNYGSDNIKTNDEPIGFEDSFETTIRQPIGFDRKFSLICIVLHECLHSAAFYILVPAVYFIKDGGPLDYSDNKAAVIILVFTGIAFLLPLIGGIIGDTVLGRYKAILFGTVMEFIGIVILLIYTLLIYADNNGTGPQMSMPVAQFLFVTALIVISLGMGFIKANITTFGAGQLYDTTDSARKIQSYFRWYIFSINIGKLIAFCPVSLLLLNYDPQDKPPALNFTTPPTNTSFLSTAGTTEEMLHDDILGIGACIVQLSFVGMAIFIFMIGKTKYKMIEPTGSHHMYYIFGFNRTVNTQLIYDPDYQEYLHQMKLYKRTVFRLTLLLAALFAMYTVYESIAFQLVSTFMLQFKELSQPEGIMHLPLTFMNTFSTLVLIIAIPILECFFTGRHLADDVTNKEVDQVISNWTAEKAGTTEPGGHQTSITKVFGARRKRFTSISCKFNADELNEDVRRTIAEDIAVSKHRRTILIRMAIGIGLAGLVALCAGALESVRKNYLDLGAENQPSVFWQIPQYLLMGMAEIVGEISAFEFASTESLPGLQGFTIGMFVSTYGLGSFFALMCYAMSAGSIVDPADLNDFHMEYVFFGQFCFLIVIQGAFIILARQYHIEHPCRLEEPKCPYRADEDDDRF